MRGREKRNLYNGIAFISPWIVGMSVFLLYPVIASFYYSLCDYNVLKKPAFIGLWNYQTLMQDEVFVVSLKNTLLFAFMAIPTGLCAALLLAVLLNQKIKGRSVWRTFFFLPSLVPLVALGILWQWLLNGQYGLINYLLGIVGIKGPNWLGTTFWAKPALVLTGIWGVGGAMIIFLAGLQDVPTQLYEAAEIDGANAIQRFFHITVPMISPIIYFNLIMGIIGTLQVFAVPYVMTGGGPARATYFYTLYLYDSAFTYLEMGYASAMAWILFIIIFALTLVTHKLSSRYVQYGGSR
jgi:multiple sugar transport system permease protein